MYNIVSMYYVEAIRGNQYSNFKTHCIFHGGYRMKKFVNLKLLSLVLTLVVALSSTLPVFAAETEPTSVDTTSEVGTPMLVPCDPAGIENSILVPCSSEESVSPLVEQHSRTIYNNATFTFHHSNTGNAFYCKEGFITIEVTASAPSNYSTAPLVIDFCTSEKELVEYGTYHNAEDYWIASYEVPEDGYYCLVYSNSVPYGDYYNFAQTITITVKNYYWE